MLGLLNSFHKLRVLVLGDVMLDRFVYGAVDRISPEAPIPVMAVKRSLHMPGGAGNVVRNCAALGAQAVLVGVVGEDADAGVLREQFEAVPGVVPRLIADASRPTTIKTRYVADRQQILRTDIESRAPLDARTAETVLGEFQERMADSDVVVLSDYAKGVLSDSVTQAAIARARAAGKTIIADPKSRDFSKYHGVSILTPNRNELQLACGVECTTDEEIATNAQRFIDRGVCDTMVVTRGEDGMSIVSKGGAPVHLRTTTREVYDVSGAGDTVLAVLALGLGAGGGIEQAARLANLAAGVVVGKHGTATVSTSEMIVVLAQAGGNEHGKVFGLESAVQLRRSWQERGLKVAFTNGCFDLLHPGHVSLLEQARRSADRLIVGLNSDASIRRLKGETRPVQDEIARATVLTSLKPVDAVVIFGEDTPLRVLEALEPDVLVKGSDYTMEQVVGAELVTSRGGKVVLADLVHGHSTTGTLQRLAQKQTS
jgi:D-beta-D-heptose 7-phosphate kinase/D-beta-D-heptose 1-phosphate adenosyltransferase